MLYPEQDRFPCVWDEIGYAIRESDAHLGVRCEPGVKPRARSRRKGGARSFMQHNRQYEERERQRQACGSFGPVSMHCSPEDERAEGSMQEIGSLWRTIPPNCEGPVRH